jgi:hypothetical protein
MGKESKVLRDLLADVISGVTVNTNIATTTDLIRAVVNTGGDALNISIGGGSGTAAFPGNVTVAGDLYVSGTTYEVDQYVVDELIFGSKTVLGSWRFKQTGANLLVEVLTDVVGQVWTVKGSFLG